MDRAAQLLEPQGLTALEPGPLWHLAEQLEFVRENILASELEEDFQLLPGAKELWTRFLARELEARGALRGSVDRVASAIRSGALGPVAFRDSWERLGFESNAHGAGTPADDYLDAVSQVSRLTVGETRPDGGNVNLSSRAHRISDFLNVTRPGEGDTVIDIGSGSGKLALTVAASTTARVIGIEYGESYVAAARRCALSLGVPRLVFEHSDVRDADLSPGTIFFLYYPFHGAVAQAVAETLGALAREKDIAIYLSGPSNDFADHFTREVDQGSLCLSERRGEFSEVLVLRSARS